MNFSVEALLALMTAVPSDHFVNMSIAKYNHSYPPTALGKGPKTLSPQTVKGHDRGMVLSACAGW